MTNFIQFARAHGVEIDPARLYPSEKIKRCGTVEKPRSRNGAYFWDGQRGWVFNWAGQAQVQWFNDPAAKPWTEAQKDAWKAQRQAQRIRQEQGYQRAAQQAHELLRTTTPGTHSYLHSKGFPQAQGLIAPDGALLIPMRHHQTNALQGVQMIRWLEEERRHEKKMQPYGMKAAGAVHRMGANNTFETCLVEGYATGLSLRDCLHALRMRYRIHITFSAGNLVTVAAMHSGGYVIADNDESGTGERVAIKTGFPYYLPEHGDFNDFHQKAGTFRASQCLRKFLVNQQLTSQTDRPSHYGAANALQTATKPDIRTPVPGKNFHEYQYQNHSAR